MQSNLKRKIKEFGYKSDTLAAELEVSKWTVHKWRSGKVVPSLENMKKLVEVFGEIRYFQE